MSTAISVNLPDFTDGLPFVGYIKILYITKDSKDLNPVTRERAVSYHLTLERTSELSSNKNPR
jgi:hypothetical protein